MIIDPDNVRLVIGLLMLAAAILTVILLIDAQ